MSAAFFGYGATFMANEDIRDITSGRYNEEQHDWGEALAAQRAEYLAGSVLLVLAFVLQFVANVIPPSYEPTFLHRSDFSFGLILSVFIFLLLLSMNIRDSLSRASKEVLRKWRKEELATPPEESNQ